PPALQRAATRFADPPAFAVSVPANVNLWTQEVLRTMFLTTLLKNSLLTVTGLTVLALGTAAPARTGNQPGPAAGPPRTALPAVPAARANEDVAKLRQRLNDLMRQRAAAARQELAARMNEYKAGRGTLDVMLGVVLRVRQAELDLATGPQERV